jgi:hypothetical protein
VQVVNNLEVETVIKQEINPNTNLELNQKIVQETEQLLKQKEDLQVALKANQDIVLKAVLLVKLEEDQVDLEDSKIIVQERVLNSFTKLLVVIAKKKLRFLLNQLEANLFIVEIAFKKENLELGTNQQELNRQEQNNYIQ